MENFIQTFKGRPIPNNKKFKFLRNSGFDTILTFGEDKLKALISTSILYGIVTNENFRYILQLIKTRLVRRPLKNSNAFLEILQSIEQAKILEEYALVLNDQSKVRCFTDGLSEFIEDSQFNGINKAWVRLSYYFNLKISFYSIDKLLFEIADYPHSCPLIIDILQLSQNQQNNYSLLSNSGKNPEYLNPKKMILDENAGTIKRTIIQFSKILSNCKISQESKEKLVEKLNMLNRLKGKWNIEKDLMSIPVDSLINVEEIKDGLLSTAHPSLLSEKTLEFPSNGLQKSIQQVEEVKIKPEPPVAPVERKRNPDEKLVPVNQKAILARNDNPGGFPQMPKLPSSPSFPEVTESPRFEPPRAPERRFENEMPEKNNLRPHCLICNQEGEVCFLKLPCECKLSFECIQMSWIETKCVNCKKEIEESWKEENKIYFN